MNIEIVSDTASFKLLLNDWKILFSLSEHTIFQSFEFNYHSWEAELSNDLDNRLCIILLEKNNSKLAIFPFYIDSKNRLRFINDDHADFCDYVSEKSFDFEMVYDYLRSNIKFHSFRLINLKRSSKIYNNILCVNSLNKHVCLGAEYSMLSIDKGDFPYNVPHYRSHQKHRINKANRKYEKKTSLVLYHKAHPFPSKDLLYLRDLMISSGARKYDFLTDNRLYLIESLYNSGFVIFHFLKDKHGINTCNIMIRSSATDFMFWIDLFDDSQMINIASYIRFISSASLDSSLTINFGRGRYFYKVSNFSPIFDQLYEINIFNSKWEKIRFRIMSYLKNLLISLYKKVRKK